MKIQCGGFSCSEEISAEYRIGLRLPLNHPLTGVVTLSHFYMWKDYLILLPVFNVELFPVRTQPVHRHPSFLAAPAAHMWKDFLYFTLMWTDYLYAVRSVLCGNFSCILDGYVERFPANGPFK